MPRVGRMGRLALVVVVIGGIGVFVVLSGGSSEPACEPPQTSAIPSWFPDDIPLPAQAATLQEFEPAQGLTRIGLAVPLSLDDTVAFILEEWPGAGWELGVGEREPWEAENTFVKSRERYGQFRALRTCDPERTDLYLTMTQA